MVTIQQKMILKLVIVEDNSVQHCIKIMRKFIPKSKVSACLLASDFPKENPCTQTTHYSYT